MNRVTFRFYAELNDFLPPERRGREFVHTVKGRASLKDTVEALGVPHTEVDLILVNGQSAAFSQILEDGDQVSVYPVLESIDISGLTRVRPKPLRSIRFVLDTHLGKLASYLRMLGFDSLYDRAASDPQLAETSFSQHRVLLTRDRGLLRRSNVTHGYCVRAIQPREQLREIIRRFDLSGCVSPFSRCMRCNGMLEDVSQSEIADQLPPRTRREQRAFKRCTDCGQIYWQGSHHRRMQLLIDDVLREKDRAQ